METNKWSSFDEEECDFCLLLLFFLKTICLINFMLKIFKHDLFM